MPKGEYLGEFEQLVILALLRLGEHGYGMTVRRELEETARRSVTLGSVYATLDRLEEKGFVTSSHSDPDPSRGGHPRRYFKVEPAGEQALARSREMIQRMWEGIDLSALGEATS